MSNHLKLESVDDIIRQNRDRGWMYLSTIQYLHELQVRRYAGGVKGKLENWRFVTEGSPHGKLIRVLGDLDGAETCIGPVVWIDKDLALFKTEESIYSLGVPGEGQPPRAHLEALCAVMHRSRLGPYFGVPEIYDSPSIPDPRSDWSGEW